MRRQLPFILVFAFGLFMIFQYFVPHESSERAYEFLLDWTTIIGIFALAVGIWSLVSVTIEKIKLRKPAWQYSFFTLAGLFLMILFGFTAKVDGHWGFHFYTSEGLQNPMFRSFFDYILTPIQATMFSMLAFFIASAAYRAFRARNVLATLLLIAALIMMMRFNPFLGPVGPLFEKTANWLLNVPSLAANRAIIIGIGLGMVATALKVILGIERGYMGK
ncbi:MAG: hypothetical protein HY851_03125 [candidate division Zixibacteria bacterium]|nr:hypothetical protein [candidate division Zixibacteria bacterium]